MRAAFAILTTLVVFLLASPSIAVGDEEHVVRMPPGSCIDYSGAAFTFCIALCETPVCTTGGSSSRCATLRRGFRRVTGEARPPCGQVPRILGRSPL